MIKRGLEHGVEVVFCRGRRQEVVVGLLVHGGDIRGQELVRGRVEQGGLRLVQKLRGVLRQRGLRQVGMLLLPHHLQHLPRDAQGACLVAFPAGRLALRA